MQINFGKYLRDSKRRKIAGAVFIAAILILYITNALIRAFAYHDGVWQVLWDFLPGLLLGGSLFLTGWLHEEGERALARLRNVSMMAVFAPALATFFSFLTYQPDHDQIDIWISIFAMLSMCVTPCALRNLQTAWMAILAQAVWFVLLAAYLGSNVASIVTIFLAALVLTWQIPKRSWRWVLEGNKKSKMSMTLITLLIAAFVLVAIRETGVAESIVFATLGRPGLNSSAAVNRECTRMLQTAKLFGPTPNGCYPQVIFENRVLTLILAEAGWLALVPVLLATIAMLSSGIFLCCKQRDTRCHWSAAFMTVIAVQTAGYILMCAGWDELLFPELCPFLDGGMSINALFLVMAAWLLPSVGDMFPRLGLIYELYDEFEEDLDERSEDEPDTAVSEEVDLEAVLEAQEALDQEPTAP